VLLLVGAVQGYLRGGVRQVTGLAGWLLGVMTGLKYMHTVGNGIQGVMTFPDEMVGVVGFTAAFLIIRIIAYSAGSAALTALGWMGLRIVDRVVGVALGGMKSALTLSLFLMVAGYVGLPSSVTQTESRFYHDVKGVMPQVYGVVRATLPSIGNLEAVPHQITDVFNRSFLERIGEKARSNTNEILNGAAGAVTGQDRYTRSEEGPAETSIDRWNVEQRGKHSQEPMNLIPPLGSYPTTGPGNTIFPNWMGDFGERSWPLPKEVRRNPPTQEGEGTDIWGTSRPGFQDRAWRHEDR